MRSEYLPGSDRSLETALTDVAPLVTFPATPDIATSVTSRLGGSAPIPREASPGWSFGWRQPLVATAAGLVIVILVTLVLALILPGVRSGLADRLGIPGLRIVLLDRPAPTLPPGTGVRLRLGTEVSLEEAARIAPFSLVAPAAAELAKPDVVYVDDPGQAHMVTFLYRPEDGLAETSAPGVGALLMQFSGSIDGGFLQKGVYTEEPTQRGLVVAVEFGGRHGFWVEGHSHFFAYLDPTGEIHEDSYRLSANALVWEQDGRSLRFETALSMNEAIAVAETVGEIERAPDGTIAPIRE